MYKRKTIDCWMMFCNYGQGWEYELTEYSREEIKNRIKEYNINSPYPYKIKKCREKLEVKHND